MVDRGIERTVVLTPAGEAANDQGILDEFEELTVEDDARRTKWLEGVVHR